MNKVKKKRDKWGATVKRNLEGIEASNFILEGCFIGFF